VHKGMVSFLDQHELCIGTLHFRYRQTMKARKAEMEKELAEKRTAVLSTGQKRKRGRPARCVKLNSLIIRLDSNRMDRSSYASAEPVVSRSVSPVSGNDAEDSNNSFKGIDIHEVIACVTSSLWEHRNPLLDISMPLFLPASPRSSPCPPPMEMPAFRSRSSSISPQTPYSSHPDLSMDDVNDILDDLRTALMDWSASWGPVPYWWHLLMPIVSSGRSKELRTKTAAYIDYFRGKLRHLESLAMVDFSLVDGSKLRTAWSEALHLAEELQYRVAMADAILLLQIQIGPRLVDLLESE
jgi:hypothetical protein